MKIQRALISVSDKTGIKELGKFLVDQGVEIWASGGTRVALIESGIPCREVSVELGQPEMLEGRVKTLSSQIAAGILFKRDSSAHIADQQRYNFKSIDLVVCNLYPFEKQYDSQASFQECIENIDIGGPTIIRAAAKNFSSVAVLTSHEQYETFKDQWVQAKGDLNPSYLQKLATEAWQMLISYDLKIQDFWLTQKSEDSRYQIKYGENPHQRAWFVTQNKKFELLSGETLSFNNLNDLECAMRLTTDLSNMSQHSVAILKHGNPCGVSVAENGIKAMELAWASDPLSAFGSVISVSSEVNEEIAHFLATRFVDLIAAPSFAPEALTILQKKSKLKVVTIQGSNLKDAIEVRTILGGSLLQERDHWKKSQSFKDVTNLKFSNEAAGLMSFGEICVKALKSNAICVVRRVDEDGMQLVAFGSGQTNRIDCITKLIAPKLEALQHLNKTDCLVVSDAFFPFSDSIEALHRLGFKYVLQPGGSKKDSEVIEMCNRLGLAMVFTGVRHFFH